MQAFLAFTSHREVQFYMYVIDNQIGKYYYNA